MIGIVKPGNPRCGSMARFDMGRHTKEVLSACRWTETRERHERLIIFEGSLDMDLTLAKFKGTEFWWDYRMRSVDCNVKTAVLDK